MEETKVHNTKWGSQSGKATYCMISKYVRFRKGQNYAGSKKISGHQWYG